MLAKQRRRRERLNAAGKAWGHLQDAATGYGFRPARALIWLITLIALSAAYLAIYPPTAGAAPLRFQPILYAFYVVIPVVNIGQPNPYSAGSAGQWIIWIAQLAGWILATTVIAGTTRALTRD